MKNDPVPTVRPREGIRAGRALWDQMRREFDYTQVAWTICRYNPGISEERAKELLDAFLQWIAIVPMNTENNYATMFKSPVEEAFHCFVLNTRVYYEFCETFLGEFFHHDPLTDEDGPEAQTQAGYTVNLLLAEYGDDLHPELQQWCRQFEDGTFKVACVGCRTDR